MVRAYTTDRAPPGLPSTDDVRRAERKRWFEHVIMVPVSFGMVTAVVGNVAGTSLDRLLGEPFDRTADYIALLSAAVAVAAFLFAVFRVSRR